MGRRIYGTSNKTKRNSKRKKVHKKKFARFIAIVAAIAAALIIIGGTANSWWNIPEKFEGYSIFQDDQETVETEINGVPLRQIFIPGGYAGRPGIIREIKYVVIHETANADAGADALSHSNYLMEEAKNTEISWHYTVDDGLIVQNLPDNEVGWHAGDGTSEPGGNMNGIGVEICVNEDGDFATAKDNAAKLTAYLLNKYNLSLGAVKQHADFMDKDCPMIIRDNGQWDSFIASVQSYL